MFSFHKPKIYRSNLGCCICKAKSSSSRFTDSKKYENEFERCFRIEEKRSGEICNACVLLVKRWKKLSPENRQVKHWHHVVDARAGPGTKLTGNRRQQANYGCASTGGSSSECQQADQVQTAKQRQSSVLPLSSSQANNQSGLGQCPSSFGTSTRRTNSFSNKARAIDTNVSTFTFGEPYRRHHGPELNYSTLSSSSFTKPHSALNSSAFESVIKRFRQRKQQEQQEAERRRQNRLQRLHLRSAKPEGSQSSSQEVLAEVEKVEASESGSPAQQAPEPSKRIKRHSDSIGSLTVDGTRVSSLLDGSLWRKERICCGIIFRGLNNEVAVFPKLLKPCSCRLRKMGGGEEEGTNEIATKGVSEGDEGLISGAESPPPRTMKSGSVSSCDSNTSGTGSMEQPMASCRDGAPKEQMIGGDGIEQRRRTRQAASSRARTRLARLGAGDTDSLSSSGSSRRSAAGGAKLSAELGASQRAHSPAASLTSSSSASSSRLLLMADVDDCDPMDDDVDDGLILADEDESTTDDTASSVSSLNELARKKSAAGSVVDAAMG